MDIPVNFLRDRHVRHDRCGYSCTVDLDWYERYSEGAHGCPGCGARAEFGDALQFCGDPADPVLEDHFATELTWFHSSTNQDWPNPVDFSSKLTDETRQRMGEESAVRWAHRQSIKALHIGTCESAVHNMFRRMTDQGGKGEQFYLYGVRLRPDVAIQPGPTIDPSNSFGDVWLDEIATPETDVVRYVNVHEDPGGLSAAVRPSAIAAVQCLPIPLATADDDPWVVETAAALRSASIELQPLPAELSRISFLYRETHRAKAARETAEALASSLPATMQRQFEAAVRWEDGEDPTGWARRLRSLVALVEDPERVLDKLAARPVREL